MLPEEPVLGEEAHAQRAAQAVPLVLAGDIDFAAQDQVEPVLARMLRVAEVSLRVAFDVDLPVLVIGNVQPRVGNRINRRGGMSVKMRFVTT